jgi:uracil-DNA glycosylase
MQKRISSFFSNGPPAKRTKPSLGPTVTPVSSTTNVDDTTVVAAGEATPATTSSPAVAAHPALPDDVVARIEANRAAAVAKLKARGARAGHGGGAGGEDTRAPLEPSWRRALALTLAEPSWTQLLEYVARQRASATVYPEPDVVFSALNNCPLARTKVVIIGQDPYHGPRQAHGMCFSVNRGLPIPPSLRNIYKELADDIPGWTHPGHGNLEHWAKQGVLLLNSVLTVEAGKANSHKGRGWERFTDAVVHAINKREGKGCVFMLWGGPAKLKGSSINQHKHCILRTVHPSPLSASQGFFGSKHFSLANKHLIETNQTPIDWNIPK